ncbi:hypothetical protein [Novosphingobium sp.]|uniref:hypothetical protein n=1 Tax=Novosphingobium sp. TaxID=1874826 RepID=UPI001EC793FA|nr:hypothetical protein [Novosphingobium sp.]MBK6802546.1 hypothetical protein [Novosphingobium sp.]MBK9009280.1 hypothetical protein [Novosphingobium sp.]
MFTKPFSRFTNLDKAIALSVGAMLAMNIIVLAQQVETAPSLAAASAPAPTAQQA